ncbi:MAG: hypothetical protein GY696_23865 [Gammaproteobacteria bacterium]|nr:hypothetical protein [Gammaproteobacteria bacterium]
MGISAGIVINRSALSVGLRTDPRCVPTAPKWGINTGIVISGGAMKRARMAEVVKATREAALGVPGLDQKFPHQ